MTTPTSHRLLSLDILRGFDLFLLVFFQPVFVLLISSSKAEWLYPVLYQFDHESWIGFRFWDLIMPLFMFMAGVSMPFSLDKYRAQGAKHKLIGRILKRVLLLYLLGGVVQGNFLGLDAQHIYLYSNTLQAIAAGYLISSLLYLFLSTRMQIAAVFLLLLCYWLPMTLWGDLSPAGNLAERIDNTLLGRFRDMAYWDNYGVWHLSPHYHYTWILSSLNFGVTVMLGVFSGKLLKTGKERPAHSALNLLYMGLGLTIAGLLLGLQMPIIKRIWSSSMTLFSGGLCVLLLALFYYLIDVRKRSRGLLWLKIYGMNSITAYVLGEAVNFRSIVRSLLYGLEPYTGDYYNVIITFGNYCIVFFILWWMYRCKIFIKV